VIKSGKGYRPVVQPWVIALVISAALVGALRGIAKDVHFRVALLGEAFVADAGWMQSVPREVVEARQLLAGQNAVNGPVALEPGLKGDSLLQQRMWEGLYPIHLHDADHGRMLWMTPGPQRPGCTEIARSERIVLVHCN
jgi:hypothetical protein